MIRKKFLSLILIICSVFVFCGCANIEYQRITDDTGQIIDKLVIELNEKEILQTMSNIELQELKRDIQKDLDNYVVAINYTKPQLQLQYPDMDFSTGIVAETTPWEYVSQDVSKIYIEIYYKNSDYMLKINGGGNQEEDQENSDSNTEIISDLFISKYMMYSDNVFMGMEEVSMGSQTYFDFYTAKYSDFTVEDVTLTQVYGTTDSRLKSNADYKTTIDGINYHLWEIDTKNGGYNTAKLSYYYTTAIGTGWYLVALALTFVLAFVLLVVYIIRKNDDRKYKQIVPLEQFIRSKLEEIDRDGE